VRGASIKGEYESLRDLLLAKQAVTDDDVSRADDLAATNGGDFRSAVVECAGIEPEQIESLHRDHVEHAVFRMFTWRSGEFNFEVGEVANIERDQILLTNGVNTQYLAMEASRQRDESVRPGSLPGIDDEGAEDIPMFSGEGEAVGSAGESNAAADPVDEMAMASARNVEHGDQSPETELESASETVVAPAGADDVQSDCAEAPGSVAGVEDGASVAAASAAGSGNPAGAIVASATGSGAPPESQAASSRHSPALSHGLFKKRLPPFAGGPAQCITPPEDWQATTSRSDRTGGRAHQARRKLGHPRRQPDRPEWSW